MTSILRKALVSSLKHLWKKIKSWQTRTFCKVNGFYLCTLPLMKALVEALTLHFFNVKGKPRNNYKSG